MGVKALLLGDDHSDDFATIADFFRGWTNPALMRKTADLAGVRGLVGTEGWHPDLIVRVTGFSAYFASLSPEFRQLVVNRILASGVN